MFEGCIIKYMNKAPNIGDTIISKSTTHLSPISGIIFFSIG